MNKGVRGCMMAAWPVPADSLPSWRRSHKQWKACGPGCMSGRMASGACRGSANMQPQIKCLVFLAKTESPRGQTAGGDVLSSIYGAPAGDCGMRTSCTKPRSARPHSPVVLAQGLTS